MIYGLNFNLTRIPLLDSKGRILTDTVTTAKYRQLFADRLKRRGDALVGVGWDMACDFILQGVCQTEAELTAMLSQANNGHRKFHVARKQGWIAVYCG